MTSRISFAWDERPDAAVRVVEELYGQTGEPVPECGENSPGRIGVVSARRDGVLLGWAEVNECEGKGVRVDAAYAPREVRRIVSGCYDMQPPNAEEYETAAGLYRRAAEQARASGHHVLRCSGGDTAPEGRAALALGAQAGQEFARIWSAAPALWELPAGLPRVEVRQPGEPSFSVATENAEIQAGIDGPWAYVNAGESIRHEVAEPTVLAGLLAELVVRLRRDHPEVVMLNVFEFDDGPVRRALELSGLRVTARCMDYEITLVRS